MPVSYLPSVTGSNLKNGLCGVKGEVITVQAPGLEF